MIHARNVKFVKSAVSAADFPKGPKPQIVFAGRSNVGKSSLINRLLGRRNLARVGNEPGKTVHINFFDVDDRFFFVDLPGYGYARRSFAEKERWGRLLESYFATGLIGFGVLIVDIRHAPTADDRMMADWFRGAGVPFAVAANKLDKLRKNEISLSMQRVRDTLLLGEDVKVIAFSAAKGDGKDELWREIIHFTGDEAK